MSRTIERQKISAVTNKLCGVWCLLWILGGFLWVVPQAHAQDTGWKLRDRGRRQKLILRRFQQIVEKKPDRGFAFQRMVQLGRRWPGLDRLVAEYRQKVKRSPNRLAFHLILGHLLHRTGQKLGALGAYESVLKLSPQNELAHLYRSRILQDLQRYPEAFAAYEEALKYVKQAEARRRCLKALGTLALLMKQPKRALVYWKRFFRESPNNVLAREEIARVMARNKLYNEAMLQWREVLKRRRGGVARAGVLRQMGVLYEESGKWQEAVRVYRQAVKLTQQGHWLRRELGARILQLHRENGKLAELAAHLQKQKRKYAADYASLAQLYDELGRDQEARKAYVKALSANPRDTRLRLKYITLLEVGGKIQEGVLQYRALIRYEPSEPRYRMAFAEMLSRAGKQKESLAEMAAVARRFSRNTEILSRLAALYRRRRMHKEANALLQRLMRVDPRDPSHRNTLGTYYYNLGQTAKARSIWKGILRSGLGAAVAYTALGQIYRTHGLERDALEAFRRAARAKPKDLSILRNLGEMFRRLLEEEGEMNAKELKEAIGVWKKIHTLAKNRGPKKEALRQLFSFYHAQGTLYRLPIEYRARLRKRPGDLEALRFLGEYYLWQAQKEQRDNAQARRFFERILTYKKDDLDAILTLERLEARRSRWYQAKKYLLLAVEFDKKGRRLYYRRLYGYSLKLHHYREAIMFGRRVVELHPEDASAHAELARIYHKSKRMREAISSYQEALRLQPHNYGYHQALGHLYRDQGETEKAIERYMFVLKNAKEGALIYDATVQVMTLRQVRRENDVLEVALQTLAERNPRELAYFRALAELYFRQGRMKEYRIAYLKAAATVDQKSQVYKKLAEAAQEQGNIPKAIIYFRKMLEETTNPPPAQQIHLAELYLQVGDRNNARKLLLAILNENPNSVRILLQVAQLFERNQLVEEAIYSYELFLELQPMEHGVRMSLARLYLQKQHFEPAMGLLESVFWQEEEKALRKVAKKVRKVKKSKTGKTLPRYMRRHRYFSARYRSYYMRRQSLWRLRRQRPLRAQALELLLGLYARTNRMDEWYRRVLQRLRHSSATGDSAFHEVVTLLRSFYRERQLNDPLRLLYETLHQADPTNARWSEELAQIYTDLGMKEKALALMRLNERQGGRKNFRSLFASVQLHVQWNNQGRLRGLLRELLYGRYSRNYSSMLRVLQELEKLPKPDLYRLFLKGLLTWGHPYYRTTYQRMLVKFYLRHGMRALARKELLLQWARPSKRGATIQAITRERSATLRLLWPLLRGKEQESILRDAEQRVTDTILLGVQDKIRHALVDAKIVVSVARGEEASQAYLPALWGVSKRYSDRGFRRGVLQRLLNQRNDVEALKLIKQEASELTSASHELGYLYLLLVSLKQRGAPPSEALGRFLERGLRRLYAKGHRNMGISNTLKAAQGGVPEHAWLAVALRLGKMYLEWSDTRRSIWWLEACRWLDRRSAEEPELLKLLYEAYREQGMRQVSARYRRKLSERLTTVILKDKEGWARYLSLQSERENALFQHTSSFLYQKIGYRSRAQMRLARTLGLMKIRRIRRMPLLESYKMRIAPLAELYSDSNEVGKLVAMLKKRQKQSSRHQEKNMFSMYLLGSYLWDWESQSNMSSLRALLKHFPKLLQKPLAQQQRFAMGSLYGKLLVEALEYKKAMRQYKAMMFQQPSPAQERSLLHKIAELAGHLLMEAQERAAYAQLASKHNDPKAHSILAEQALSKKQLSEAVRHYTMFVRSELAGPRYRSFSAPLRKAEMQIRLASFLLGAEETQQGLFRLQRALDTMRLERNQKSFLFKRLLTRILGLYQQVGKLREQVALWEKARQGNQSQDLHLLMVLSFAYNALEEKGKSFLILTEMLKVRPYELQWFYFWTKSYKEDATEEQRKVGLKFLLDLYADPKPKPKGYHTFLGESFLLTKQRALALAAWRRAVKNCSRVALGGRYSRSRYAWFSCTRNVGLALLKAGFVEEFLKIAKSILAKEQKSYMRKSYALYAIKDMIAYKAYPQVLSLLGEPWLKSALSGVLDGNSVELLGSKAAAHKALGQTAQYWKTLFRLMESNLSSAYESTRVAGLLEGFGAFLAAEYVLWRAFGQGNSYMDRRIQKQLCSLWQRRGLGSLCGLESQHKMQSLDASALAERAEKEKLHFVAGLLRRQAWLKSPRDQKTMRGLLRSCSILGRKEEVSFLQQLYKRWYPSAPAVAVQPIQKGNTTLLSRWSLKVPSYCGRLVAKDGRLQASECAKQWTLLERQEYMRCPRQVTRAGDRLFTNDCRGHLLSVDASKGRVHWVKQLIQTKLREVVSRNRGRLNPATWLDRNLHVTDIQPAGDELIVAINESWFEWGSGWVSGIQNQLYLFRISQKDGKVLWSKVLPGNYVQQHLVIAGDLLLFRGRLLHAFSKTSGKPVWTSSALGYQGTWLLESGSPAPLVVVGDRVYGEADGFLRCLRLKDGKEIWSKRLHVDARAIIADNSNLVVMTSNSVLLSLDAQTGDLRWRAKLQGGSHRYHYVWWPGFSVPFRRGEGLRFLDRELLVTTGEGHVLLFDRATGQQKWSHLLGNLPWYAPLVLPKEKAALVVGQTGTANALDLASGRLLWSLRFSPRPSSKSRELFRHAPPILLEKGILFSSYTTQGNFLLQSIPTPQKAHASQEKRLLAFFNKLLQEKKQGWADALLMYAADPHQSRDRAFFVRLASSQHIDKQQRLFWCVAQLRHAPDLRKHLLSLEPTLRGLGLRPPESYFSTSNKQEVERHLARFLLYSWLRRRAAVGVYSHWWAVASSKYRAQTLDTPLSRRILMLLLKEGSPSVRWWSAAMLAVWGSSAGNRVLLEGLASKRKNPRLGLSPQQKMFAMRLLVRWSYSMRWEGLLEHKDLALLQPLLTSREQEIRILAALFLSEWVIKDHPEDRRFDTLVLRRVLREFLKQRVLSHLNSTQVNTLRFQAAYSLSQLGERAGIDALRRLVRLSNKTIRNRAARKLFSQFGDYSGKDAIFDSVKGTNRGNLRLPSFQLIFANNLLGIKDYAQALLQFRLVFKMPTQLLSPVHKAKAALGIARSLARLKRYDEATTWLAKVEAWDPSLRYVITQLQGFIDWKQTRLESAEKKLLRFLQDHPLDDSSAEVRGWLARIYFEMKQPEKAMALFQTIFERDAGMRRLRDEYYRLASAILKANPSPTLARVGLKHIRQALKLQEDLPRFLAIEAGLLYVLGQRKAAKSRLLRAINFEAPRSPFRKEYMKQLVSWRGQKLGKNKRKRRYRRVAKH